MFRLACLAGFMATVKIEFGCLAEMQQNERVMSATVSIDRLTIAKVTGNQGLMANAGTMTCFLGDTVQ